jgi:acetyl-CoA decarbonylase/synthase complex subunit gamma
MAMTGLDIFKLLPKTNCGDCGVPTCLAFAMKLAQKKAELSECPHVSEEAKSVLGAASEPPMRVLKVGVGADAFEIGGETEMFRHEKTFYHQTAIAIRIEDTQDLDSIAETVVPADRFVIERIGEKLHIDAFYLANVSGDGEKFLAALQTIMANSSKPVILGCSDLDTLKAAMAVCQGRRSIVDPGDDDVSQFIELVQEGNAGLVVNAGSFDDLAARTDTIIQAGCKDLLLNLKSSNPRGRLENNIILRRAALRRSFKPFGFSASRIAKIFQTLRIFAHLVRGDQRPT